MKPITEIIEEWEKDRDIRKTLMPWELNAYNTSDAAKQANYKNYAALVSALREAVEVLKFYGSSENWDHDGLEDPNGEYDSKALRESEATAKKWLRKWVGNEKEK